MDFFVVLSPAAFLAFNYITYGRLIRVSVGREHSYIRPEIVGRTFVISDIFTFVVQGAGGAMQVQVGTATAGRDIFLVGIAAQGASYILYDFFVVTAHRSARRAMLEKGVDPHKEPWWKIFKLIYFSSLFIIIRSIYRVLETSQGQDGYLFTHEWCFLAFDSIPLAIATAVYIFYWPGSYIPKDRPASSHISHPSTPDNSGHHIEMSTVGVSPLTPGPITEDTS